jgi:hypothetical protein
MGVTRLLYARAVIQRMRWDRTPAREMTLVAVMTGEDSRALWNGMDTTMPMAGATPYNSFGPNDEYHVWNYATAMSGVEATVATLSQANMRAWVDVIALPRQSAETMTLAFERCPWGGFGDALPLQIVQDWLTKRRDYKSDANQLVYGNGVWPYKRNGKPA